MRLVAVESEERLSMRSMHGYRSRLVSDSAHLINQAHVSCWSTASQSRRETTAKLLGCQCSSTSLTTVSPSDPALLKEMLPRWETLKEWIEAGNHNLVGPECDVQADRRAERHRRWGVRTRDGSECPACVPRAWSRLRAPSTSSAALESRGVASHASGTSCRLSLRGRPEPCNYPEPPSKGA